MDDLEQFYLNNEIYISAALSDGISVSLLEAMASGCICVVSDFPSNLEVISDSYNGYVFKNNDPESLLNTIEKVIALSVDQRKFIANNARDFVGKNANWETNKSILSKIACDL
jgi:glycosyltransferase involved in cell wall biosynthesis